MDNGDLIFSIANVVTANCRFLALPGSNGFAKGWSSCSSSCCCCTCCTSCCSCFVFAFVFVLSPVKSICCGLKSANTWNSESDESSLLPLSINVCSNGKCTVICGDPSLITLPNFVSLRNIGNFPSVLASLPALAALAALIALATLPDASIGGWVCCIAFTSSGERSWLSFCFGFSSCVCFCFCSYLYFSFGCCLCTLLSAAASVLSLSLSVLLPTIPLSGILHCLLNVFFCFLDFFLSLFHCRQRLLSNKLLLV